MRYLRNQIVALGLVALATFPAPAATEPPKEPAKLDISVSPSHVAPGQEARVTVRLQPKPGIKINRYPKIKLLVPAREGLVTEARAEVGNDKPPAPDAMDLNYFEVVDPVELTLSLDDSAPSGEHQLEGKLTYFYCVAASGFCAPKRVSVMIPVAIRLID